MHGRREELERVLRKLEPPTLQEAKKKRLLDRLDLGDASPDLLRAILKKIGEIERSRRSRDSILEREGKRPYVYYKT